jgi:hypothetical protein
MALLSVLPPFTEYIRELVETLQETNCTLNHVGLPPNFPWDGKCHNFGAISHGCGRQENLLLTDKGTFYVAHIDYNFSPSISLAIVECSDEKAHAQLSEAPYLYERFIETIASAREITLLKLVHQLHH